MTCVLERSKSKTEKKYVNAEAPFGSALGKGESLVGERGGKREPWGGWRWLSGVPGPVPGPAPLTLRQPAALRPSSSSRAEALNSTDGREGGWWCSGCQEDGRTCSEGPG